MVYFGNFHIIRDYRAMPHQDRYDPEMLDDDDDVSELSYGARREVEREMRIRDRDRMPHDLRRNILYGKLYGKFVEMIQVYEF